MSGYLQRIASRVLHPQRAIHPAVGSLWMPQRNAIASEQLSETSASIVPRRSTRTDEQETHSIVARMGAEQQSARLLQDLSAHTRDVSNAIGEQLEPVHPLLHERNVTGTQAREGLNVDASARGTTFTPLVATSSREAMLQPRGILPPSTLSRERVRPFAPVPAPQPDEIEIHIGRIEVAAVLQQPTPRLPARPARKPLDLGEYLKRDRRDR
jgi:hypothetical protein